QDDRHMKSHAEFENVRRTGFQAEVPALRPIDASLVTRPMAKDLGMPGSLDDLARGGVHSTCGDAGFDRRDRGFQGLLRKGVQGFGPGMPAEDGAPAQSRRVPVL